MSIIQHIIRRLVLMIPMLMGITLLLFVLTHIVPVDPLAVILTEKSMEDPNAVAAAKAKWGEVLVTDDCQRRLTGVEVPRDQPGGAESHLRHARSTRQITAWHKYCSSSRRQPFNQNEKTP